MSQYGETAVAAVQLIHSNPALCPAKAWAAAIQQIITSRSGAAKVCPKNAFLGLCEEGLVRGIPSGKYTRSKRNKVYALNVYSLILKTHGLIENKKLLWRRVTGGTELAENGQLDVVIALFKANLLLPAGNEP